MDMNDYKLIMIATDFTDHRKTDIPEHVMEEFPNYVQDGMYMVNSNSKWFNMTWNQITKRVNDTTKQLQEMKQSLTSRHKRYQYITGWEAVEFTEMFYSGMCHRFADMPVVIMVAVICDELKRRNAFEDSGNHLLDESEILS